MSKTALKLALETAEQIACADYRHWEELASLSEFERWARSRANHIADALRACLAQPEPEPVAWGIANTRPTEKQPLMMVMLDEPDYSHLVVPLYPAQPQREWVGLTDEEMLVAAFQAGFDVHEDYDNEDDPDTLHWWSEDGEPCGDTLHKLRDIIEAKIKEKNT